MPPTNNWCHHDNNKVATQTKSIFRHPPPPTISNCMQNLREGGQNFSFPTLLDSYRELLLTVNLLKSLLVKPGLSSNQHQTFIKFDFFAILTRDTKTKELVLRISCSLKSLAFYFLCCKGKSRSIYSTSS